MISGSRASDPAARSPVLGGKSSTVPTIQVFGLAGLPGGGPPGTQPSSGSPSSSNDVVPWPVETTTSSTKAPAKVKSRSFTEDSETSTRRPAYADRSMDHCS
jgi:hypothetical protein